jgi:hypothetical protein
MKNSGFEVNLSFFSVNLLVGNLQAVKDWHIFMAGTAAETPSNLRRPLLLGCHSINLWLAFAIWISLPLLS